MGRSELINKLMDFLTEERKKLLLDKLEKRTRFLTVVVEDVYQPHNASAILRTCDAFGLQDVYVVEKENRFKPNTGVSLGAEKWLNIITFKSPEEAYKELKRKGYSIAVTVPPGKKFSPSFLPDFKPRGKLAVVFGSELEGVSKFFIENADVYLTIPMYGFVESFNVSVSLAIVLYDLVVKCKERSGFFLTEKEKEETLFYWLSKSIKNFEKIVERVKSELK